MKTTKKQWRELALMVDKLNKVKINIKVDHFNIMAYCCPYQRVPDNQHIEFALKYKCMHSKHFETSTGKTYCDIDECPIIRENIEELNEWQRKN